MNNFNNKVQKLATSLKIVKTLRLIWSVASGWTTLALILITIESLLFVAALYIFKLLIDTVANKAVSGAEKEQLIIQCLAETAVVTVVYVAVKAISALVTQIQAAKVGEYIDDKIHANAIDLDMAFYESPLYFDTLKRAKDAGPERPNAMVTNLVDIVKNLMMFVSIGSVIISINWLLLPLLILLSLPTLFVKIKFADILFKERMRQTSLERKSAYISSLITGDTSAKEIRSFRLGNYLRELYLNIRLSLLSERLKISRNSTRNEIITSIMGTLGFFACIAYICISTVNGKNTVGDLTLFLFIFPQLFSVIQALSGGISQLYQNNIYVTNIFELFNLKASLKEPDNPLPVPDTFHMDLEINNVSFKYPHADELCLNNISLTIPSGKIIAIAGLNGAGKTTLIKLLSRLYDPTSGEIKLGGTDIRQFKSTDYRKQISTVFQDFGRYNVSAADNIRFGDIDGNRNESEITDAAKKSGAHDYISKFPDGYNTMMGRIFEDGHEVSIGQWQKLAIARSLYSLSRFIILDEATSAQDAQAEQNLFEFIREKIGNRGALIISHRLSAIKHADYIYVLSNGSISQSGTHDELLSQGGDYARLFKETSTKTGLTPA